MVRQKYLCVFITVTLNLFYDIKSLNTNNLIHLFKIYLMYLGWQRYPSGSVGEVNEMPDSLDFQENYVLTNKPVAFRKVLRNVPAMENWMKKNYLKDK